jgi:hypothetical protein
VGRAGAGRRRGRDAAAATVDALERLSDYEDLGRSMAGEYAGASMEDIDEEKLRRTLGDDAFATCTG